MSKEKPCKCWTSKVVGGRREEVFQSRGVSPTLFRVLWAHFIELRRPHALYAEMRVSWVHVNTLPSLNLVLGFALNDRELAQTRSWSWDKSGKSIHLKGHLHISSLLNIEEDHLEYGADENHLGFLRWPSGSGLSGPTPPLSSSSLHGPGGLQPAAGMAADFRQYHCLCLQH